MSMRKLTHQELVRLVNYDPETGILTRKVRTSNRVKIGDKVGSVGAGGYLRTHIAGSYAYVHQFVWFYVHGVWPDHDIDHRDGNTQNNRISNLRKATESQNSANKKRPSHNTSGFKGVYRKRKKWCAEIKQHGKKVYLGVFATPELAHAAYCDAAASIFGEFARAA